MTHIVKFLRPLLISLMLLVGVFMLVTVVFIWYLADDFATPKRRGIQAYHQQILRHPELEGIAITEYACAEGNAPCLFITADHSVQLGKRGELVRNQLQQDFSYTKEEFVNSSSNPKGVVVLLHGRHGRKEDLLPVAIRLVASGFVCVLIDLPNHGDSPMVGSRFGTELGLDLNDDDNDDIVNQSRIEVQNWLRNRHATENLDNLLDDEQTLPTFLWGMSMGGSYANYAMAISSKRSSQKSSQNWQGLIIVSSLADMSELADKQADNILQPLPEWSQSTAKSILLTMFNQFVKWQGGAIPSDIQPASVAQSIEVPVLQFHGTADRVIDISQGRKLHTNYASENKTWVTVEGAGHNDILVMDYPVYATMADWMLRTAQLSNPISESITKTKKRHPINE